MNKRQKEEVRGILMQGAITIVGVIATTAAQVVMAAGGRHDAPAVKTPSRKSVYQGSKKAKAAVALPSLPKPKRLVARRRKSSLTPRRLNNHAAK